MLAEAVCDGLRQHGWRVDLASDAFSAKLALVEHFYAVVLLDIGLPGDSGLTVLKALRERFDATPVIVLTARDQLSDRIRGLDAGADDYLVKPFQFDELFARIRAVIRRSQGRVVPAFIRGDVVLDPSKRTVTKAGQRVALSAHEYRTLITLMSRPGRIVTRDALEDAVYGGASQVESNTISVFIHQLRRKLGDDLIVTLHGQGYTIGETLP